jgi:hypothetical protein
MVAMRRGERAVREIRRDDNAIIARRRLRSRDEDQPTAVLDQERSALSGRSARSAAATMVRIIGRYVRPG